MGTLFAVLLWLDRLVNVALGGNSRETLSSRAHRMDVKDQPYWGWTAKMIDTLFFWDANHCREQWEREQAKPFTDKLFPRDKVLHFAVGLGIALAAGLLVSPWYGLLVAMMAGALKELHDHFDPLGHSADFWDFVVTCLGGYVATAFLTYV